VSPRTGRPWWLPQFGLKTLFAGTLLACLVAALVGALRRAEDDLQTATLASVLIASPLAVLILAVAYRAVQVRIRRRGRGRRVP